MSFYRNMSTPSWVKPNLHGKQEVRLQVCTRFCCAAKYLLSNQIAAFQSVTLTPIQHLDEFAHVLVALIVMLTLHIPQFNGIM